MHSDVILQVIPSDESLPTMRTLMRPIIIVHSQMPLQINTMHIGLITIPKSALVSLQRVVSVFSRMILQFALARKLLPALFTREGLGGLVIGFDVLPEIPETREVLLASWAVQLLPHPQLDVVLDVMVETSRRVVLLPAELAFEAIAFGLVVVGKVVGQGDGV